jgi:disulfide bond formation protein DsbB
VVTASAAPTPVEPTGGPATPRWYLLGPLWAFWMFAVVIVVLVTR